MRWTLLAGQMCAAGLAGAMTAGIVFAAIGDIALVLALYGRRKWGSVLSQFVTSHAARPPQSPRMPPLWLAVLLVYGAAFPNLPVDTPPLFSVLGIAMLVFGALVPVLAALPAALREVREIRAAQRARRTH